MTRRGPCPPLLAALLALACSSGSSQGPNGPPPTEGLRAFFTDLTSGPGSGGEGDRGAFVTVYGKGFGTSRGASTVTVGGGAADNYPLWSDTRITFQLGAAPRTGDLLVNVASKGSSNALPFTVRAGNIYFVSSSGNDANPGTYASPWATIPMAKNSIHSGDIAYIGTHAGDAVAQTGVDPSSSYACALGMSYQDGTNSGTQALPKALVVYPGASATIGDPNGPERGILTPGISGSFDYWVIAGFTLRGLDEAIEFENAPTGWRVVGNDISCPNGSGLTGCVEGNPTELAFLGNEVHDAAANVADSAITKYYHGVYFGSSHVEVGWNVIRDGKTCRALQFHDTGGPNEFDLHVHDNLIHGTVCDGINFATVDPSQGPVEAYNNVIYAVGQGPDPVDGSSDYAGIYVAGTTEAGTPGGGTVLAYNNTLYDCGSWTQSSSAGAFNNGGANPSLTLELTDNIVVAASPGESYFAEDASSGLITGTNNLFYGAGAPPAGLAKSVGADPAFAAPGSGDFHLKAGSPAIGAGPATAAATDYDGDPRPSGGPFDLGAYEYLP